MIFSNILTFGFLTFFWLLSYIHHHMMQELYYQFIAWMVPATWLSALWVLIALIVGGVQEGGETGMNILSWFIYAALMVGIEAIAWWQAPNFVKFYQWDSDKWWDRTEEDAPKNWPALHADFIDY